jgi:hypothetical protein
MRKQLVSWASSLPSPVLKFYIEGESAVQGKEEWKLRAMTEERKGMTSHGLKEP